MTHMTKNPFDDIREYGSFMMESAARSLVLLRTIERTVLALRTISSEAKSFVLSIDGLTKSLVNCKAPLPEEEVLPIYESIQTKLETMHTNLRRRCALADRDRNLCDDDGVSTAFRECINSVSDLHSSIETFRWMLLEHNADLDEATGPVLTDADEIQKYLKAL